MYQNNINRKFHSQGNNDIYSSQRRANNTYSTPGGNTYKSNAVMTAAPGKLLLMVYDGAIKFCKEAEDCIENTTDILSIDRKNKALIRAQDILTELRVTLKDDVDPDFSKGLKDLYVYMEKELMIANAENNKAKIVAVRTLLSDLRDAWAKVV